MTVLLGYDPDTLRERVDLLEVGHRLDELGEMRSLDALCERAWLLKVAGRLPEALDIANAALRQARFTGERRDVLRPRILRATVMQADGRLDEALGELNACVEEARTQEWYGIEAVALQHRGKVRYDRGDYAEAAADFKTALRIREDSGAPADQSEASRSALEAAQRRLREQQDSPA